MRLLPMFPLQSVLFPGDALPLRIFEPRYGALVRDCLAADDPVFGVVLIAAGSEVGGGDARYDIGGLARIVEHTDDGGGRYHLLCRITERLAVSEWLDDDPYPRARARVWPDEPGPAVGAADIEALEDTVMELFERIAAARGAHLPSRAVLLGEPEAGQDAGARLFVLAGRLPIGQADRHAVLAAPSAAARLTALRDAVETMAALIAFQLPPG